MANIQLSAQPRSTETKAKALVRSGVVPAVIYGHKSENVLVTVDPKLFSKMFSQAGESSLIELQIEGQAPLTVLVKDVQYDLLKRTPVHVDFQQVRMDEVITVEVGLNLIGESPAVKNDGAVLVESLRAIHVECLPGDLQHEVDVDISGLAAFGDSIHIKDLSLPASWKLINHDPEEVIVSVMEPKVEAEPTPVVAEVVAPVEGEAGAAPAAGGEVKEKE
jgi:large subunit ribosomal protein L25